MKAFEKRRDRFEFFDAFENPLLNLTFRLEVPDFLAHCKERGLPPFHFFLFQIFQCLRGLDNFKYRIHLGEVIKIDEFMPSYTVLDENQLFNYTRFENSQDLQVFIQRSQLAKAEALAAGTLINTGIELDDRTMRNYVFITSIPWLEFTSIQHPVFRFKSADIPSLAWGKFTKTAGGVAMPFSVQAHHGFVDAYHVHQLAQALRATIERAMDHPR